MIVCAKGSCCIKMYIVFLLLPIGLEPTIVCKLLVWNKEDGFARYETLGN